MDRRKLFQKLFECYKNLMADWSRGYFKRSVQPQSDHFSGNLEMSGILVIVRDMSGIMINVRGVSGNFTMSGSGLPATKM
jgi:hypothetical protein